MTNPMQAKKPCGAHCRTTGQPCKNPPVTGSQRCRMHGGRGSGRPVTTGLDTRDAKERRKQLRDLNKEICRLIDDLNSSCS